MSATMVAAADKLTAALEANARAALNLPEPGDEHAEHRQRTLIDAFVSTYLVQYLCVHEPLIAERMEKRLRV